MFSTESSEFVNNRVATLTLVVCYQFLGWRLERERERNAGRGSFWYFSPAGPRALMNSTESGDLTLVVVCCCRLLSNNNYTPPQGEEIARRAGIVLIFYFPPMGVSRSNCGPELFHDG